AGARGAPGAGGVRGAGRRCAPRGPRVRRDARERRLTATPPSPYLVAPMAANHDNCCYSANQVRLRSIRLTGFKTFARQTDITFDGGVTAVVGPNGSGKSNTVDAFKWVLGERNAKEVRGRKMEEVIYSGGQRRARANE